MFDTTETAERTADPAALSEHNPGVELAALLAELDLSELPEHSLVEALIAHYRQVAHTEALFYRALAEFARRRPEPLTDAGADGADRFESTWSDFAADEVGAALGMTRVAVGSRFATAVALVERLPGTLDALQEGRIDSWKARVIVDETAPLDAAATASVEARVLPKAAEQTPSALRAACKRAAIAADPAAADARHEAAQRDRCVRVTPLRDGMAELHWTDSADHVLALSAALDALARRHKQSQPGEARCMDQLRSDALATLAQTLLDDPRLPRTQGARPHISLVVPLGTVFGLTDEAGELAGYGPVPPALARSIAAQGTWRRLLTDPVSGALLDVGRTRYRPPAEIREFVIARDGTCQGINCRVPARRCDLDHTVDWAHGGRTAATSMSPLCRHTHRLKQAGWKVRREDDGLIWTTPTGHEYRREPDPLPGATVARPFTEHHFDQIRRHAHALGLDWDASFPAEHVHVAQGVATTEEQEFPAEPEIPPF